MLNPDLKKQLSVSLTVSLLLSFTLFFFIPIHIYLTNTLEFNFIFPGLLLALFMLALAFTLLLFIVLFLIPYRSFLRQRAQVFIFAMGFLLWLQGNVLVWRYGPLDGRQIPWSEKMVFGLVDGAIWLAVLVLAQLKLKFFSRFMKATAWALVLLQLLFSLFYYFNSLPLPNHSKYVYEKSEQFNFSSHKNVIILLIDCFQSDLFQEVLDEDDSLRQIFTGFTYFRNNLGGFPLTYASVPLILTGKYYDNSQTIQRFIKNAYFSPSSLPLTLRRNGIDVDLYPATMKVIFWDHGLESNVSDRRYPFILSDLGLLMDVALFRGLPHFAKRLVFNDQKWFLKNLLPRKPFFLSKPQNYYKESRKKTKEQRAVSAKYNKKVLKKRWRGRHLRLLPKNSLKIPDVNFIYRAVHLSSAYRQPTVFKFYHLMGVHSPFRMNENLDPENMPATRTNWKRLVRGELKLVKIFLSLLSELEIYDDALILVMGDHGHPRGDFGRVLPADLAGAEAGPSPLPAGVIESATPLLMAKRRNSRGDLKISDAPVSVADIAKTIFSELQIETTCPGESIFNIPETVPRPRYYYYYTWTLNDWKSEYLPPLYEYLVDGHSWLTQNWRFTGRVLRRP
ncbi:MAG TPA: sulfatase-like hydrolase/transferase [Patescibacteria group bacterium]|nr:sulfatase-like hydrolase/transferase [Patescibacteria group bacterium]